MQNKLQIEARTIWFEMINSKIKTKFITNYDTDVDTTYFDYTKWIGQSTYICIYIFESINNSFKNIQQVEVKQRLLLE